MTPPDPLRRLVLASGLLEGLTRVRGRSLPPSDVLTQNNALQAWPWLEGTFSWVEPTSYCLLALKRRH